MGKIEDTFQLHTFMNMRMPGASKAAVAALVVTVLIAVGSEAVMTKSRLPKYWNGVHIPDSLRQAASEGGTYNVAVIAAEPFTCREKVGSCWPSGKKESRNGCVFNGIRTVSGECVHGYMPDMLNMIADVIGVKFRVTLLVDPGYTAAVGEVFAIQKYYTPRACSRAHSLARPHLFIHLHATTAGHGEIVWRFTNHLSEMA